MNVLLQLVLQFAKTGLFAVGGGLATLPFLYEMSDATGWFTHADIADMIAISESTPGAIGINMSTYAGYQTAGFLGGICATLGLALPSVIIIIIVFFFISAISAISSSSGRYSPPHHSKTCIPSSSRTGPVSFIRIPSF